MVELLVVVAIVAFLAALLFPVFASARLSAKNSGCMSNLRQLGLAVQTYAQDYDDLFPYGIDFGDKYGYTRWDHPFIENAQAKVEALAKADRILPNVMSAYVRNRAVWCCPADTGMSYSQFATLIVGGQDTGGKSAYEAFGMSYGYRTELGLLEKPITSLRQPSEVNVLMDGAGYWHTRYHRPPRDTEQTDIRDYDKWSFNVLFADWHVKNLNTQQYLDAFGRSWQDQDPFDLHDPGDIIPPKPAATPQPPPSAGGR